MQAARNTISVDRRGRVSTSSKSCCSTLMAPRLPSGRLLIFGGEENTSNSGNVVLKDMPEKEEKKKIRRRTERRFLATRDRLGLTQICSLISRRYVSIRHPGKTPAPGPSWDADISVHDTFPPGRGGGCKRIGKQDFTYFPSDAHSFRRDTFSPVMWGRRRRGGGGEEGELGKGTRLWSGHVGRVYFRLYCKLVIMSIIPLS